MNRKQKIDHIAKAGYQVVYRGKNISASKEGVSLNGPVNFVHRLIFGY